VSYVGTNFGQEIMGETMVNKSIYKTSTLPVQYRPVQIKPEIGEIIATPRLSTGYTQINGGTTIRPSIVKNSVLPTINQGTTVLNTVFGGTRTTIAPPRVSIRQGVTTAVPTQTITTTVPTQTLTRVLPTQTLTTVGSTVGYGSTTAQYGIGAGVAYNGKIMGVSEGVGDLAADVTYSTKPDSNSAASVIEGNNVGLATTVGSTIGLGATVGNTIGLGTTVGSTIGLGTTGSTVGYGTTASQYAMGTGATYTGKIMGVSEGVADNAADVTYSTKPNANIPVQQGLF
jgi:hypothetical protein